MHCSQRGPPGPWGPFGRFESPFWPRSPFLAKASFFGQGPLFLAKVPFSPILDQKTQNDSCESPYPLLYASRFLGLLFTWLLVTLVPFWLYHPRIPTMHLCQPGPSDDCDDDADVVMAQVRMMQGSWKLETVSQHEISISMCWSTKLRREGPSRVRQVRMMQGSCSPQ